MPGLWSPDLYPESPLHVSMGPVNWGSTPGMGKDQIPLGSRQVPPFMKSDELRQVQRCPRTPGRETCVQLPI